MTKKRKKAWAVVESKDWIKRNGYRRRHIDFSYVGRYAIFTSKHQAEDFIGAGANSEIILCEVIWNG